MAVWVTASSQGLHTHYLLTYHNSFVEFLLSCGSNTSLGTGFCVPVLFSVGAPWRVPAASYHSDSPLRLSADRLVCSSPLAHLGAVGCHGWYPCGQALLL